MAVGLLAFWLLPDFPNSGPKRWLSDQEQRYAEYRLAVSFNNEVDTNGSVKDGIKAAVLDPKVWCLVFIQICILSSQTWTYFFPTIVKTLGYGNIESLLLTSPVYIFGFITSIGNALIAQRTGKRAILIMWPLTLDIVGNIMVVSSHITAVRFTGMFMMCAGSFSAFNVIQAWIGSTIPRTRTKRAVSYAMVNMCKYTPQSPFIFTHSFAILRLTSSLTYLPVGNLSNIYGAYFFPKSSGPQYIPGGVALSSFAICGVIAAACFALYLRHLNKKATEQENADGEIRYKYIY